MVWDAAGELRSACMSNPGACLLCLLPQVLIALLSSGRFFREEIARIWESAECGETDNQHTFHQCTSAIAIAGANRAVDVGALFPGGDCARGGKTDGRSAGGDAADGRRRREPLRRHGTLRRRAARQERVRHPLFVVFFFRLV